MPVNAPRRSLVPRRVDAALASVGVTATPERPGVGLVYQLRRRIEEVDHVEDFADLGGALTLETAAGIGKLLRLLRAARIAAPDDARVWLGDPAAAAALAGRAVGAPLVLEVLARTRVVFTAWTEDGVEAYADALDVSEDDDAVLVRRRGAWLPVRIPLERIVRRETRRERWFEVLSIERP